ncbi:hypothetical protein [Chryseobacterium sp.]|uniref:hypothetical protein n=1 Tax=Chryseobacterium sp. TaxID=1871047 RepID=UPI00333FC7C2
MKKIIFYGAIAAALYLTYIISDIVLFQLNSLNSYGFGFLTGKISILLLLGFIIYKANPFNNKSA